MSNKQLYSPSDDTRTNLIEDVMPSKLIRVYPYEMPNSSNSEEFIGNQATSIVYITQTNLDLNNEFLQQDSNNDYYFDMIAGITSEGKLDLSSSTSTLGQELKEEDSFICVSNWYYETELENIQIGKNNAIPAVFTVGKPFDKTEYENGTQAVFIAETMNEAKPGQHTVQDRVFSTEGLYEFTLVNMTAIENTFTNSKVLFTSSFDTATDDVLTSDGSQNGITLGFENHTLVNYVKGKGKVNENIGGASNNEFGEINFVSKEPLAPFKMTPVSVQDKVTMYADWFDYDVVMPFIFIEKFRNGGELKSIITNTDDLHMVEDMLAISAGFAESWASVPVLNTSGNAGKLDPTFRIGHAAIKVSSISGKDPIKVVDGIYENHIRKFPAFSTDIARYQPVKEALAALSRYIYSSYCIGQGQNAFNQIYLPWYLETYGASRISFNNDYKLANPDQGSDGKDVTTYALTSGIKFQAKSNYFRSTYSSLSDLKPTNDLILPPNVNLSNIKMIQTDRKLTIPELPYTINEINKLPLPGDIDTTTSNDLQYIFYLPIKSQTILEEFFLNKDTPHNSQQAGQPITVSLNPGHDGKVWTQQEANSAVSAKQQGQITTFPIISNPYSSNKAASIRDLGFKNGQQPNGYNLPDSEAAKAIQKWKGYEDVASIKIIKNNVKWLRGMSGTTTFVSGSITYQVSHSEFTPSVVTSSGTTSTTFSFQQRQVLFDKQQWKRFLHDFSIIPNGTVDYHLLEKNDFTINTLSEISISSCWGNIVEVKSGGTLIATVELFNQDDETIGTQRIIFT